ncbi:MAG: deoxyribonuclease IV [Thermoguttaceae bacterium]
MANRALRWPGQVLPGTLAFMPILGAHMSIAGGYDKAVHRAEAATCDCLQLFTKNNNQWYARPIADREVASFRQALQQAGITHPIGHDSYLINLASPDPALWQKSVRAFLVEMRRAERLGLQYLVTHPGCYIAGDPRDGLRRVARALDKVFAQTAGLKVQCLLETTAGQGTSLGWRFEQLAAILDRLKSPERLGICFDTCHVFAAGYELGTPEQYQATIEVFERMLGLDRLCAFHLNDSARPLGSRVDRHAHIGRGKMGLEPFRLLLGDPRFQHVPMYLETPKGRHGGQDWDVVNLRTLRGLVSG